MPPGATPSCNQSPLVARGYEVYGVNMTSITPCLWFESRAQEALDLYTSVFPDAHVASVTRWPEGSPNAGALLSAEFELAGQRFILIDGGGPGFTDAVSFSVLVETQEEIDRYWEALLADGGEESMCGWLRDRFGVAWQITPSFLGRYMADPDPIKATRVSQAMMQMRKLVIADLEAAYAG
jgi:predicted 3-demethylubiquinone-9 3-methyltransferase (glyoxalase superfamily)